jgi:hypothetical protein
MPDTKLELRSLPKQWVVNVGWTVVGDDFGQWVKKQIEARNEKLAMEQGVLIEMDPDVAAVFHASS